MLFRSNLPDITTSLKIKYNLFNQIDPLNKIKIEPLKTAEMLMLSVNTSTTVGMIKKINSTEIEISLKIPIVPFKGDDVGIARNINNHWRLIGHGEII